MNTQRHIGIDARLTHYRKGGIANYIEQIIVHLPHVDSQNRYSIFHSRKDDRDLAQGKYQVKRVCWTPPHNRFERLALSLELLPHGLDLLHSPDFIPPAGGYKKSVITIHDLTFLHYPQFLTQESRRYYNDQIAYAVEQTHHIMTDSEATRQDVIDLLSISPDKVTTVWLGISEHFQPASPKTVNQMRTIYNLPTEYILFVGTFEPRKNLTGLIEAYRQLLQQQQDMPHLVLAGRRGWLSEDIFQQVEQLGLQEQILWREEIAYADMPALYSGAQLLCLPSHYEGFGFPPLEAMACGTPVVIADKASLPEVVGDAGVRIDPEQPASIADGVERVLSDGLLSADLIKRGFERVKLFDWQQTAERVYAVYQQVLSA